MDYNFVLLALIGITVLISYKGFQDTLFFKQFQFNIGSIKGGEQYRMITSGFLHGDLMHLIFNMYALYSFAPVVIAYFGNFTFILVYFVSLLAGSFLTYFFNKNNYSYSAIGASGAVTGIVYAAILLEPGMSLYLFFIPIPIPAYVFGIGYLLYSIYGMKAQNDGIGHSAHFGGAIGGYVFTIIKYPEMIMQNTYMVFLLAVPIVILFVMKKQGKI